MIVYYELFIGKTGKDSRPLRVTEKACVRVRLLPYLITRVHPACCHNSSCLGGSSGREEAVEEKGLSGQG